MTGYLNRRSGVTHLALYATLIALLAFAFMGVPAANATFVSLGKMHTPSPSPWGMDPTNTYDKFHRGDTVTFDIELNVLTVQGGPALSIRNLNFTDVLPAGLTYVANSQTSNPAAVSFTYDPVTRTLVWIFGPGPFTTAPQATASFEATVDNTVVSGIYLTNGVTAEYYETITNIYSAPSTSDTVYVAYPILDIDKECTPKTLIGGDIIYTVTLSNTGAQDAEGVEVTDVLPAGVVYTTGTATATSGSIDDTTTPGTIVWTGTIASGGTVTITIPVVADAAGVIVDTAEYTQFPDWAEMIKTSATCETLVISPSISLDKVAEPEKVLAGTEVTYTYTVENTGDVALTVDIDDDTFGVIADDEPLAVGETKVFVIVETINVDTTNVATATGTHQLGTVSDDASAFVDVISPDISLTKTCEPDTQIAPGTITYNITVSNTGDVPLTVTVVDDGDTVFGPTVMNPGETESIIIVKGGLPPGEYTNTATATGAHQLGEVTATATSTCTVEERRNVKQFTASGALDGFMPPEISEDGLSSTVYGLYSGPRIFWEVTYYFENSEEFLGYEYDGEGHYFILWDKWGGNLMALGSAPVEFDPETNMVTLENGDTFKIDPADYKAYVGEGIELMDCCGGSAWITLHTGDQQEGTNPGQGKGTGKDGKSYDTDVRWEIGWLDPGEGRMLRIIIAPGKNPGGVLQFSSPGCFYINTGPRVRVYADEAYEDFLYAIDKTVKLEVCVVED